MIANAKSVYYYMDLTVQLVCVCVCVSAMHNLWEQMLRVRVPYLRHFVYECDCEEDASMHTDHEI